MAKKEECSNCPKAKSGGYKGEIHCAYYGRMPKYDGSACTYYDNRQCPNCGAEINTSLLVCPSCGQTLKQKPQQIVNRGKEDKKTIFTLFGILLLGLLATFAFALLSNSSYGNRTQEEKNAGAAIQERNFLNNTQESQRNYEEAMRKAEEAQAWLEKSVNEFEQLLIKQNNAESMSEYVKIEEQKTALKNQKEEKIRERDHYLNEARIYQNQMNK